MIAAESTRSLLKAAGSTVYFMRTIWRCLHSLIGASSMQPRSLDICTTQRSPVHRVQMHGASNRDTHLYPPHNISSVHLTATTYVRHSGRITNGMRSGRTIPYASEFSTPAPTPRNDPPKKSLGSTQPPPHRCRTFPLLLVQMGYGFLCGLWVWRRKTNRRPCCRPPLSNTSTSSWTARPDGSGWWDNWMAAQHLPIDLVRSSGGFNNSLKRKVHCLTALDFGIFPTNGSR